jgi:hypothetical protein
MADLGRTRTAPGASRFDQRDLEEGELVGLIADLARERALISKILQLGSFRQRSGEVGIVRGRTISKKSSSTRQISTPLATDLKSGKKVTAVEVKDSEATKVNLSEVAKGKDEMPKGREQDSTSEEKCASHVFLFGCERPAQAKFCAHI